MGKLQSLTWLVAGEKLPLNLQILIGDERMLFWPGPQHISLFATCPLLPTNRLKKMGKLVPFDQY